MKKNDNLLHYFFLQILKLVYVCDCKYEDFNKTKVFGLQENEINKLFILYIFTINHVTQNYQKTLRTSNIQILLKQKFTKNKSLKMYIRCNLNTV